MYDIIELNSKLVSDLRDIAKQLNIPKVDKLLKQDLIYQILDHQALNPTEEVLKKEKKESKKSYKGKRARIPNGGKTPAKEAKEPAKKNELLASSSPNENKGQKFSAPKNKAAEKTEKPVKVSEEKNTTPQSAPKSETPEKKRPRAKEVKRKTEPKVETPAEATPIEKEKVVVPEASKPVEKQEPTKPEQRQEPKRSLRYLSLSNRTEDTVFGRLLASPNYLQK